MASKVSYVDVKNMPLYVGAFTATATGTGGTSTATLNRVVGMITTDAITTAAGAGHVMTVTNNRAAAGDMVLATWNGGTTTTGFPIIGAVATANTITFTIRNDGAAAINGNVKFCYMLLKAA
jgi:hypothetical protein